MIPTVNTILTNEFVMEQMPSRDFKMDIDSNNINGIAEGLDAVKQAIYMILNTERYQYTIYPWEYGVELVDLIGQPVTYVLPEIERRITEALLQDDRITAVDGFDFDISKKHEVVCAFTVHTIFGDVNTDKGVTY